MSYDDYRWVRPVRRSPRLTSPLVPLITLVAAVIVVISGLFLYRAWNRWRDTGLNPDEQPRAVTPRGELADWEKTNIKIYKDNRPSVVHITTLSVRSDAFNLNVQEVPEGTGSGFVWDKNGRIVTNYHVIRGASAANVTLADQSSYRASLVGGSPEKDIAVLHIDAPASKLRPIELGSSEKLQVGQAVYAIGNPFGLDQTLTTGVVSALGREIESSRKGVPIRGVIQTDAAINPGNSGGPLLDSAGLLIGVNTAIYSPSGSSAGIGFAIPVDEVNRVVTEIIRHGKVVRPGLGIQVVPDRTTQRVLGESEPGALILRVTPGGPAEKAGLRSTYRDEDGQVVLGDVITAVDGKPVKKNNDLFSLLEKYRAGDTVTLTVKRDGQTMQKKVTLGSVD
jgi:S1-C subfamily serine protease